LKVLITGAGGQLGRALLGTAPAASELRAMGHAELDIADARSVAAQMQSFAPEVVLNAAAFTGVDAAESAPEAAARANSLGPAVLAAACRSAGAWLVHVSSDYVFDGGQARPYDTRARPKPLSVYGRSKLEGELAVARELPERSTVVRASWLYGAGSGFPARMIALMQSRPQLSVVSDQVGVPTHAAGLARVLWALAARRAPGLMHWCDSGVASWYDFAVAIAEEGLRKGLLRSAPAIRPISSAEYPAPAARPPYSVLDKRATEQLLGLEAPHWRSALRETLA
jgi:dTDP-4-dehydrorhamnose reductase